MTDDRRTFLRSVFGSTAFLATTPAFGCSHGPTVEELDGGPEPSATGSKRREVAAAATCVLDVRQYGADPTGEKDSGPAFQEALDDVPEAGGTVQVPPGQYRVDSTVVWPAVGDTRTLRPARLRGSNPSIIKGVPGGWSRGATSIVFHGSGALFDLRGGGEVETNFSGGIHGLSLHGLGRRETVGIEAYNVRVAQFEDLVVRNFGVNVRVPGESFYSVWEDCLFSDAVEDGAQFGNDLNGSGFTRCRFGANGRHGVRIEGGGFPAWLDACWIEGNAGFGLWFRTTIQASVTRSYFERNGEGSIRFGGLAGDEYEASLSVAESYFRPRKGCSVVTCADRPFTVRLLDNTVDSTLNARSVLAFPSRGEHAVLAIGTMRTGSGHKVPLFAGDPSSLREVVAFADDCAAEDPVLGAKNVLRGDLSLSMQEVPVEFPAINRSSRPEPGRPGRVFFNVDDGNLNIDTGEQWVLPDGSEARG